MRKIILGAIACCVLAAAIWAANDPWKDKPYQQWDANDLQRIFQDSPWSHVVHVEAPWVTDAGVKMPGSAITPSTEMGSGGYGRGGNGDSSVAAGSVGPGKVGSATFVIRWTSSRTFREALVRDRVLHGQMTDADAQTELAKPVDGFEVAVAGADMTPFEKLDESALKTGASLELKRSKMKIAPAAVRLQKSSDGSKLIGVLFVFPTKYSNGEPAISPDEKSVEFSVTAGKFTLKSGFDVTRMTDKQGRDI
jgi:hypothetical protein